MRVPNNFSIQLVDIYVKSIREFLQCTCRDNQADDIVRIDVHISDRFKLPVHNFLHCVPTHL